MWRQFPFGWLLGVVGGLGGVAALVLVSVGQRAPIDLGSVVFPADAISPPMQRYGWQVLGRTASHDLHLGYGLATASSRALDQAHRNLARQLDYQPTRDGAFRLRTGRDCTGMACVYGRTAATSRPMLAEVARRMQAAASERELTRGDLALAIVRLVQVVPYAVPDGHPFGLLPPGLVLAKGFGDCDSKALLAHVLLGAVGIDSVLFTSKSHVHALLGVALPIRGAFRQVRGRRYTLVEVTTPNPMGRIRPDLLQPDDWIAQLQ